MPSSETALTALVKRCWSLSVNSPTGGSISARSPVSSPGCASGTYVSGAVISATATPDMGYTFQVWTGPTTSTMPTVDFPMPNSEATLNAYFIATASGGGGGGGGGGEPGGPTDPPTGDEQIGV
jgi:hypothetical protein